MQEDTIGKAIALLGLDGRQDVEAAREVEMRASAMLQVVMSVLLARVGHEGAVRLVGEALGHAGAPERERTTLALAATPSEQFADFLLGYLRRRDPTDAVQVAGGHDEAGAMILAGIAFLQERHGSDHMGAYAANLIRTVQDAAAAGEHPVSQPPSVVPVMPAPLETRAATPHPRAGLNLKQRINAMMDFLRNTTPADAQADALASFMASGLFLRERFGEPYAVGALRQVESTMSQAAALERWQPEGVAN